MPSSDSSPNEETTSRQPAAPWTGRHARPAGSSADALLDSFGEHIEDRMKSAEQALKIAYVGARDAGADSEVLSKAFANARDAISETRDAMRGAREELLQLQREYDELNHGPAGQSRYPVAAAPVVPDIPGLDLCPDPASVQTPAQFMNALRTYRLWAGNPSYRVMEHIISQQCPQKYGSSTLHTALKSDALPSLQLVRAVLTACGARPAQVGHFVSAWRRLTMGQQGDVA